MDKRIAIALLIFLLVTVIGKKAEAAEPYTFNPPGCEFTATLPSEPGFFRRCPSDTNQSCFDVTRFTHRNDQNQAYSIEISCLPIDGKIYDTYTQNKIEAIITQLLANDNLTDPPEIVYEQQENGLKIAGASGIKKMGFSNKIFMTQVWVNSNSIMTIDSEVDLEIKEETEEEFIQIMQSINEKQR